MPRLARIDIAGEIYHIINRANGRLKIFKNKSEYLLFEAILLEAAELFGTRIFAYVIMPNHWHLVVSPSKDGDLGLFMHYLTNTHTRRVHTLTDTVGAGHLYQGRYKSFIVNTDSYFLTLIKYVERNPVCAKLVSSCEDWQWGSAWRRIYGTRAHRKLLHTPPLEFPHNYRAWINVSDEDSELERIRVSVNKGLPYGALSWVNTMVKKFHLETTMRGAGRPRKH